MINPIYRTQEWKNHNHLSRVEIILVNEKLKPSATIRGEKNTEIILKKLGLRYVVTKTPDGFVIDITYDDHVYKHHKQIRDFEEQLIKKEQENNTEQDTSDDVREWQKTAPHEYIGNIYGYPKCCIDAYSHHIRTGMFPIFQKEQIPEELYYVSHTPCSLQCEASLKLGIKCKNVLEKIDPDALQTLLNFHENGFIHEMEPCT